MGNPGLGKMLLIVAGALGVLQGLLTLIGGSIAVFDKAKGVNYYQAVRNTDSERKNRLLINIKQNLNSDDDYN